MATGYSSISSQLSHGGCVGDEGRLTRSPPGPRTLRERESSRFNAARCPWYVRRGPVRQSIDSVSTMWSRQIGTKRRCRSREGTGCRLEACWRYKCLPVLLYGTEACPMKKSSLQFVVNSCFAKIFNTRPKVVIEECQFHFDFSPVSDQIAKDPLKQISLFSVIFNILLRNFQRLFRTQKLPLLLQILSSQLLLFRSSTSLNIGLKYGFFSTAQGNKSNYNQLSSVF